MSQSVYFATCGSAIQAVQCCLSDAKLSASAFVSSGSSFSGNGNYVETDTIVSSTCRENAALLVFKENSAESSCFSNTGTGVCEGDCVAGFSDAGICGANSADLEMTPVGAPGGGNPSCPASPPTPVPTIPPGTSPGSVASIDGGETGVTMKPVFSNTLPPDGQSVPGGSSGNGGSSGSNGSNGGSSNNGGGSAAVVHNAKSTPVGVAALFVLGMLI